MEKKKILFVTHEMEPYTKITPLGKLAHDVPKTLQNKGMEIRVFMPRYGKINERRHRLHEVIRLSGINIPVGEEDNPMIIKVASLPTAKIQIYFLDNEDFFKRKAYFRDEKEKFYPDNDERFIFFNRGVMEIILKLGWIPDIIHCNGWMTSLVPFYAKTLYKDEPAFNKAKFTYQVYEPQFEETFGEGFLKKAQLNGHTSMAEETLNNPGCNDLYKTGISFADGIVKGSPDIEKGVNSIITASGKPILNLDPSQEMETIITAYDDFYDKVLQS
jgi:starch synthase